MNKINIAIDGYAGCGKSTLARNLAKTLQYMFIDTGAMYRGLTWLAFQTGLNTCSETDMQKLVNGAPLLAFKVSSNELLVNGQNVEDDIRHDPKIAQAVSDVATSPTVRAYLKKIQQSYIVNKGVVMEGRDIGTEIMPDAELKIFVTASVDVRVKRRHKQLTDDGYEVSLEEVKQNLENRDRKDASRKVAPLKKADDAVCINTDQMSREAMLAVSLALVQPLADPERYLPFIS